MKAHGSPDRCRSCKCDECRATAGRLSRERRLRSASHGNYTTYNLGCRCADCASVHSRWRSGVAKAARPEDIPHGSAYGYSRYGCRCEECLNAIRLARGTKRPWKTFPEATS